MSNPASEIPPLRVVVTGAGVAGLEALLALRAQGGPERIDITLVAPESEFHYRQLAVATPFEHGRPAGFNLDEITRELDVHHVRGRLDSVQPSEHSLTLAGGSHLEYDALLLAVGVGQAESVPGSLTFRGFEDAPPYRALLDRLTDGSISRIAFALPSSTAWTLPLYELAFFTAAAAERAGKKVELTIATNETTPLQAFGRRAGESVAQLLRTAGIEFLAVREPLSFEHGKLKLKHHRPLHVDAAVSIPRPVPPSIAGLIHDRNGFVPTNTFGHVIGLQDVFAAGDATNYPVKQGGLAAQQADTAASAIAEMAGVGLAQPFHPVLRGALLTQWGPRYLRTDLNGSSVASRSILWWPPAKVAGRLLGSYLARKAGDPRARLSVLHDVDPPSGDDGTATDQGHEDAFQVALSSAQSDADAGEYSRALQWLGVAEDLELRLPPGFEAKRVAWHELAQR